MSDIIACICEGSAEKAIMEILLEANKLIFSYENVIDRANPILGKRYRNAKKFENDYLIKDYGGEKISIIYIHDSVNENFKLSKSYQKYVTYISCETRPEIEMLYIISVNKYDEYLKKHKSKLSPSEYVKTKLGISDVKRYDFVLQYFSDVEMLIRTLKIYSQIRPGAFTIYDLIKH